MVCLFSFLNCLTSFLVSLVCLVVLLSFVLFLVLFSFPFCVYMLFCSCSYLQFGLLSFLSFFFFFNLHCGFHLHFPDGQQCWASFHISVGHLHIFFGKRSIHFFCPYFNWVVWFLDIELYEPFMLSCLDPFLLISFANIFFHSVSCLFCFIGGFLCCGKLVSRSHEFIFIYVFIFSFTVLGLHCWARAFSGCSEQGVLLVEVASLLCSVDSGPTGFSRVLLALGCGLSSCV